MREDDATPELLAVLRHLATVVVFDGIGIVNFDEAMCVSEVLILAGVSA